MVHAFNWYIDSMGELANIYPELVVPDLVVARCKIRQDEHTWRVHTVIVGSLDFGYALDKLCDAMGGMQYSSVSDAVSAASLMRHQIRSQ